MSELRSEDITMSQRLRLDPLRHLRALEAACHSIASEERPGYDKDDVRIKVALAGPIGAEPSSPRQLTSSSLRQLICVEGVATKVRIMFFWHCHSIQYSLLIVIPNLMQRRFQQLNQKS